MLDSPTSSALSLYQDLLLFPWVALITSLKPVLTWVNGLAG